MLYTLNSADLKSSTTAPSFRQQAYQKIISYRENAEIFVTFLEKIMASVALALYIAKDLLQVGGKDVSDNSDLSLTFIQVLGQATALLQKLIEALYSTPDNSEPQSIHPAAEKLVVILGSLNIFCIEKEALHARNAIKICELIINLLERSVDSDIKEEKNSKLSANVSKNDGHSSDAVLVQLSSKIF